MTQAKTCSSTHSKSGRIVNKTIFTWNVLSALSYGSRRNYKVIYLHMMTALSTKTNHFNKLTQPTEPYIDNYYEYRNTLIAQFTKLFLQVMLALICGSKNKIRNYWYHHIQIVGYQPASPVQYPVKSTLEELRLYFFHNTVYSLSNNFSVQGLTYIDFSWLF